MVVPRRTVLRAQDLYEKGGAVFGNLGDAEIAVLGVVLAVPDQVAAATPPAAEGPARKRAPRKTAFV